jgi:hypothetical protein
MDEFWNIEIPEHVYTTVHTMDPNSIKKKIKETPDIENTENWSTPKRSPRVTSTPPPAPIKNKSL